MADTLTIPHWPRFLSRVEAAAYVGVSAATFDAEVNAGLWPAARRRGLKGTRLTWDRVLLDAFADRTSGIQPSAATTALTPPSTATLVAGRVDILDPMQTAEAAAMRGLADAQARARSKRGQKAPV